MANDPNIIAVVHPEFGTAFVGAHQWNAADPNSWTEAEARAAGWVPVDEIDAESAEEAPAPTKRGKK